jgi:glycosyltransferase involved in cell wall biosynthesis
MRSTKTHVVFCGDGPERSALESLVRELGQGDRVTITGFVSRAEVAEVLGSADVVVAPSIREELGSSILEAMSMGRPVVASNVGGIPTIVADHETGLLVPARSAEAIAAAVSDLVENQDLAARLGAGAREFAVANFGVEAKIEKLLALYRDCGLTVNGA